ncbi:hypothetical protein OAF01_02140 [bacterium]|nr:hypothetical protein [bacterium]
MIPLTHSDGKTIKVDKMGSNRRIRKNAATIDMDIDLAAVSDKLNFFFVWGKIGWRIVV